MSRPLASRTSASRARRGFSAIRRLSGKEPRRKPSLKIAALVAVALLAGAFALQQTLPRRQSVVEPLPPTEATKLLPAGALASPYDPLEVPDLPQSSYIVGYTLNDQPHAAYVRWNRDDHAYRIAATMPLSGGDAALRGQAKFTKQPLGKDAPVAILAQASQGASTDGVVVLVPVGDAVAPAKKVAEDGTVSTAVFTVGASARHSDTLVFSDADGDGDNDAIVTASQMDAGGVTDRVVSAYAWEEGQFRYDQALSWTLTVSAKVFPEPTN